MVRVNKTQFPKELRERAWKRIQQDANELKNLLTPEEILILEKRIAILILLGEGKSYREIGRTIDVSPRTVSFIKHHFKRTPRFPRQTHLSAKKRTPKFHHSSKGVGTLLWK